MSQLGTDEELAAVFAAVIETALDSVIVADETGRVIALNPAAVATFGFTQEEAIGQDIGALIVPHHLRAAHDKGMQRYRETGVGRVLGRRVEMEALRRDGCIIPVELAITGVQLPGRRLFTANLRDLSASRAAASEIEAQREALQQSEKLSAIGSLLASVAHELNNPLTIALGEATLLLSDVEDARTDDVAERARRILAATERCAGVVRSFLAIARRRKTEKRGFFIAPLVEGALELLAYGAAADGVTVYREGLEGLPEVFADPDQVQQIIVNLVVNATQAMDGADGEREIRIGADFAKDLLNLRVTDTGPGVPAEIAERIFKPFFSTKPLGVGTGIGLAISRDLAHQQGGRLELLDRSSKGASFQLTLPIARTEAAEATVQTNKNDRSQQGLLILIIDDEPDIAALMAEGITRLGHRCRVAVGGREAKDLISTDDTSWDALVCDLRMPHLDGPALFRWLGGIRPELADRMVFITGDALGSAAAEFLAGSGRPALEKPFTPADLERVIRKMRYEGLRNS